MQVLEDSRVVHQIQAVVNVKSFLFGQNQGVSDQFFIGDWSSEIIEGVTGLYKLAFT